MTQSRIAFFGRLNQLARHAKEVNLGKISPSEIYVKLLFALKSSLGAAPVVIVK